MTILLLEDQDLDRIAFEERFGKNNTIISVVTVDEALDKLHLIKVDKIVIDVCRPEASLETLQRDISTLTLKAESPKGGSPDIIVFSSFPEMITKGLRLGIRIHDKRLYHDDIITAPACSG